MIDAGIRIVDLDPDGFSWLNDLLLKRDVARRSTVSVLHDGSRVIQVAGTAAADAGVAAGDAVDDPEALADLVLTRTGADEVTVLDRRGLDELSSDVVDLARRCASQGELLWRSRERWNNHPAVVLRPSPEPSRWPPVQELLARVPDDHWLVLQVDGDAPFALAGRVRGGLLVELTSRPVEGPVSASIRAPREHVARVLGAGDPLAELVELLDDDAVDHLGLDLLRGTKP